MESQARWIEDGPDTLELEAVLASGLHDGIHEDQLEEMGLGGGAAALVSRARKSVTQPSFHVAVPEQHIARRDVVVDRTAEATADWFRQNYPKLKPEDLADYYREKYLKVPVPVRTGTHDGFKQLRNMLAQHVHNSNALDEPSVGQSQAKVALPAQRMPVIHVDEHALPPQLDLSSYRPDIAQRTAGSAPPRTSSIVLMTFVALIVGGLVGLGLANPIQIGTLLNPDLSSASVQAWIPGFFRN